MTDISELIGPEPMPVPSPKFPTPWITSAREVFDKEGTAILKVDTPWGSFADDSAIAKFIVEAVNEKIARDQAQAPEPKSSARYFRKDAYMPWYYRELNGDITFYDMSDHTRANSIYGNWYKLLDLVDGEIVDVSEVPEEAR